MGHHQLSAHHLHLSYGELPVLADASITIEPGQNVAILGANGSGKTSLLRCLSGALTPDSGDICVDGMPLRHTRDGLRTHRTQVQLVVQDPDDQLFSADVRRDVSFGPLNLGLTTAQATQRVEHALDALGIAHLADRPTHRLSFGQRKRVAIAGALAMRPCLMLLDEPTAGLDPAGVTEALHALATLRSEGTTVVMSTHDVDLAFTWADTIAVVHDRQVTTGPPLAMLSNVELLHAARLQPPWMVRLAQAAGKPLSEVPTSVEHLAATLCAGVSTPAL
ncbi:cilia- and flagella-associated protein 20 [Platysternon megacephalum]|uniref:Cilia-and flagella-associated protein 20 n=1 Tax=Platysternon megacephalum TaxID=55544 RepID=A0A4D9DC04_9SAUR|nr:cilia- and flagella-associated protein 20 [Platysternon megacephalum]